MLYQIIAIIIPLATTPYLARVLGPYNEGIISYTNSILAYFLLFAALGTSFYGRREIARFRDDKIILSKSFWEIELLSIISSCICLIIWVIFVSFQKGELTIFFWILSVQIVAIVFDISWLYAGLERFDRISITNTSVKVFSTILIFLCVKNSTDLWKYFLIYGLGVLGGNLAMWIFLPKTVTFQRIEIKKLKTHFSQTLIYFLPTIATTIYTPVTSTI